MITVLDKFKYILIYHVSEAPKYATFRLFVDNPIWSSFIKNQREIFLAFMFRLVLTFGVGLIGLGVLVFSK